MSFYFLCCDAWHLGLGWSGGTALHSVSWFLGIISHRSKDMSFICRPNNLGLYPQLSPSSNSYILGNYPPDLITPGMVSDNKKQPQSPVILFKLTNPKPAYPAWPIPLSLCLFTNPGASLCGPPYICELTKLSFQWQSSLDLLASPYWIVRSLFLKRGIFKKRVYLRDIRGQ